MPGPVRMCARGRSNASEFLSLIRSGGNIWRAWPTKMGNIASPWRYDAEAFVAIQPVNLRWPAISRHSLLAEIFLISKHGPAPASLVDVGVTAGSCGLRLGGSATTAAHEAVVGSVSPATATSSVVKKRID